MKNSFSNNKTFTPFPHAARGETFLSQFILYPLRGTSATRGTLCDMRPMNLFRCLYVCAFLQLFAFSCKSNDTIPCTPISNEEYHIYNLLIDTFYLNSSFRKNELNNYSIIIKDSTNLGKHNSHRIFYDDGTEFSKLIEAAKEDTSISVDLINDFFMNNLTKYKIDTCNFHRSNLMAVSIKRKYDSHYWDLFYKDYPNSKGHMDFSRVGYNSIKTKAIVYCQIHRHDLNGVGYYVFLHKNKNTWLITYCVEDWCA